MAIQKTTLHPENDLNDDLYPKTSYDQVEGLPLYEHNINITGSFDDLRCSVHCKLISQDTTPLEATTIVRGIDNRYQGVCTIFRNVSNDPLVNLTYVGTTGLFAIYSDGARIELITLTSPSETDSIEFVITSFTDTVVNLCTRKLVQ